MGNGAHLLNTLKLKPPQPITGLFLATKSHLSRICVINNFLVIGKDIKFCEMFFDGLLHVLCLGCEVENDMSGQSNNCLRLCNVKMKKKLLGQKHSTFL